MFKPIHANQFGTFGLPEWEDDVPKPPTPPAPHVYAAALHAHAFDAIHAVAIRPTDGNIVVAHDYGVSVVVGPDFTDMEDVPYAGQYNQLDLHPAGLMLAKHRLASADSHVLWDMDTHTSISLPIRADHAALIASDDTANDGVIGVVAFAGKRVLTYLVDVGLNEVFPTGNADRVASPVISWTRVPRHGPNVLALGLENGAVLIWDVSPERGVRPLGHITLAAPPTQLVAHNTTLLAWSITTTTRQLAMWQMDKKRLRTYERPQYADVCGLVCESDEEAALVCLSNTIWRVPLVGGDDDDDMRLAPHDNAPPFLGMVRYSESSPPPVVVLVWDRQRLMLLSV